MSHIGKRYVQGNIGILTIDSPPVNALGLKVREALDEGFRHFAVDPEVRAIVLVCAGRTFFAGADISEFDQPPQAPGLHEVFDLIENSAKPVVAAIHGTALGGGLELALVCHYRVAVPSARLGLPEVNLGLLPGAGGTQRLPRIIGATAALDVMTSGRQMAAAEALALGILDEIADEETLQAGAVAFAERIILENRPLTGVRNRMDKLALDRERPELFDEFRATHARAFRGLKAPENIIRAVEAAVNMPFDAGLRREAELFVELIVSPQSAALRYMFFAEREAAKIPEIPPQLPVIPIKSVGVVGAGMMGVGIAMNFLAAGFSVTIVDISNAPLDRAVGVIRADCEANARRGKFSLENVEARMALLSTSLDYAALGGADLIIEAVHESLDIKMEMFAALDRIAKPGAILASSTSLPNINEIAAATRRPDFVIGLHFFSAASAMRLLEVVRGAATAKPVIATAMRLGKQIGKLPVLSGVCPGFIANRLLAARQAQVDRLILEGTKPEDIDKAMYEFGFAVEPFQMMDIVGLDVQSPLCGEDICARLLYPVVNEAAKILEEGIAIRSSDIDVAAVAGFGWPIYTGGPMFWAETVGLAKIVYEMKQFEQRFGSAYKVCELLGRLAAGGRSIGKV